jgi:vacuolar-type H+-ATPase subunit F/Vma7
MYEHVAVIGDSDLVFPLRALGLKVFVPRDEEEARDILKKLEKEDVAVCFLHESFLEPLRIERERLEEKFCPVISGFSDYREVTDYLGKMLRELAVRATGSDSLIKKR